MMHRDLKIYLDEINEHCEHADDQAARDNLRQAIYDVTTAIKAVSNLCAAMAGEQRGLT